jgi:hypothetical protein
MTTLTINNEILLGVFSERHSYSVVNKTKNGLTLESSRYAISPISHLNGIVFRDNKGNAYFMTRRGALFTYAKYDNVKRVSPKQYTITA